MTGSGATAGRGVARSYAAMTVANVVILALTGASYIIYSRLLSPGQFAIFGTALTCSRVCVMLLDGGVRNVMIADRRAIHPPAYAAVSAVLAALAIILALGGWGIATLAASRVPDIGFVLLYVVPFLISYPLFFSSMVRLEKELRYERIALIEAGSTLVELIVPALLMLATGWGLHAFIAAAFASRLLRTFAFWSFAPPLWARFGRAEITTAVRSIRTSLWFQYAILAGAVRDNLPILLVAPVYGTQWAGFYVWALQICSVSSQFAVAAASRVALPVISGHDDAGTRYDVSARQIIWLARLLGPVLVAVWLTVPVLDRWLFDARWVPAIALLPWLLLRMMPGIGTTILYPLTFVQFGPRWLAVISTGWTIAEVAVGWLALRLLGPQGLAYSYALCVWLGVALMIARIRHRPDFTLPALVGTIMLNRPTLVALLLGGGAALAARTIDAAPALRDLLLMAAAAAITLLAYLSHHEMRAGARAGLSFARSRLGR